MESASLLNPKKRLCGALSHNGIGGGVLDSSISGCHSHRNAIFQEMWKFPYLIGAKIYIGWLGVA